MKKILLSYILILIVLIIFCILSSFGTETGYVYILFSHMEVQTSVFGLFILIWFISLSIQMIAYGVRKYFYAHKRKKHDIAEFLALHPYEKLGVLWLLSAEKDKKDVIENIFAPSILLNEIMRAAFLRQEGHFSEALAVLDQTPSAVFELATLQRIRIYLDEGQGADAFAYLDLLSNKQVETSWLKEIESSYQAYLAYLWGEFASKFPWLYLYAKAYGNLTPEANNSWLIQILKTFEQSTPDHLEKLQLRYFDLKTDYIDDTVRQNKILWLKVLMRLPNMEEEYEYLATQLLDEMFDQEVFLMWFEQKVKNSYNKYDEVERKVNAWEVKYPNMPIFNFIKWHLFQETQRYEQANALLDQYPDHILTSYLRVKSSIYGNTSLLNDLNQVFETNTNFIKINI